MPPRTDAGPALVPGRKFTTEETDLIRRTQLPDGAGETELQLLIHFAERTGLDPLLRQVWLNYRSGRGTVQCTIDGCRVVAERSGRYEGQTRPEWCGPDGEWREVWTAKEPPAAARIGVYRKGFREPVYAVARYASYVQMKNGAPNVMWAKMPDNQLVKCSEALALRKAFPELLSGLYTPDEMAQAETDEDPEPARAGAVPSADASGPAEQRQASAAAQAAVEPKEEAAASARTGGRRAHTTDGATVSTILGPVREQAQRLGVVAKIGQVFVDRYGHRTSEATVQEAVEFSKIALRAPSDDGEKFLEFLRTALAVPAA